MIKIKFTYRGIILSFLMSLVFCFFSFFSNLFVYYLFNEKLGKKVSFNSTSEEFFLTVFLTPILETIIFQYLIINQVVISYKGKYKQPLAILISGIIFGFSHPFSLSFVVITSICGFLLAYLFWYFQHKTNSLTAILYIILIHSLSNFYVFLIKTYQLL